MYTGEGGGCTQESVQSVRKLRTRASSSMLLQGGTPVIKPKAKSTSTPTMSRASGDRLRVLARKEEEAEKGSSSVGGKGRGKGGRTGSKARARAGAGADKDRNDGSAADIEDEEGGESDVMEVEAETREGGSGGGGAEAAGAGTSKGDGEGQKRKERSPTLQEEERNTRRRLNEFDIGELFKRIEGKVSEKAEEIVRKSPDNMKDCMREGLGTIIGALSEVMNGISDGIREQRLGRDTLELKMEDRFERLEQKVKDVVDTADQLTEVRVKNRERESRKAMEDKVEESMLALKVMNIDIGRVTEDKREIVRYTLDTVRNYARDDDKRWFDQISRRTRVIVLGRGTRRYDRGGVVEFTVPILFQCQDKRDTEAMEDILRGAGYHPTIHWPSEVMEFVWGVKDQVRKMGISDRDYFYKVRPEKREGKVQIKVEVKPKDGGGRFVLKGVWACPPIHRFLWDGVQDLYKSKLGGRGDY